MKIEISKIDEGRFTVREELNQEYVKKLSQSLLQDGQWNPIIVRPKENGRYEVISGHYRLQASKEAGLKEIEATVRNLPDEEADVLSLKTNLLGLEMTAREQGQILSKIIEKHGYTQLKLAEKLNVNRKWISDRLKVALDLHEDVVQALDKGLINLEVASIIGTVQLAEQPVLLKIIVERKITQHGEAREIRRQLLNDSIFTIGYQGRNLEDFIEILKKNEIELVLDARYSAESQFKPDFSGAILKRELERNKIRYEHHPEFGVPYLIQNPYKEGAFSYECLAQWYSWHVYSETKFDEFIDDLKKSGKVALMCMERYAKPIRDQPYACHRDILANLILSHKSNDPLLRFEKRIDL
jgi:ParB family chromosome partitioning protein